MAAIANDWLVPMSGEFKKPYYRKLYETVKSEYETKEVYPAPDDIFNAFAFTPLSKVKVVILGQDPYHEPGQAHGLSFSVKPSVEIPPSLVNIYKELHEDCGCYIPNKPIVHINVIGEGVLFQAHLVFTPQFKQIVQGQIALRHADALCQVMLDFFFLFPQPLQGCIIDGVAFPVFRSPTVHIQPVALAINLAILQNTAFIVFTSLHINSPFHSQNVEKEPYAMSIP